MVNDDVSAAGHFFPFLDPEEVTAVLTMASFSFLRWVVERDPPYADRCPKLLVHRCPVIGADRPSILNLAAALVRYSFRCGSGSPSSPLVYHRKTIYFPRTLFQTVPLLPISFIIIFF